MYKLKNVFGLSLLSLVSATVSAHEGHDHAHWMSDSLHLMFYGALFSALAAGGFLLLKTIQNKRSNNEDKS